MEKYSSVDKRSSFKVDKAVKFLSLPDIKKISANAAKAEFLKSKGLNQNEVSEAFHRHCRLQGVNPELAAPQLTLHAVNNFHDENRIGELVQHQNIKQGSIFFNFCQKLILFAGITSTFYVIYEKLLRSRIDRKKTEKTIREELNQIRNELAKISNELRQYQSLERSQATLMSEINSLKAILVGRQYFEEKQTAKLSLPSWQLNDKTALKTTEKIIKPVTQSEVKSDTVKAAETNPKKSDSLRISPSSDDKGKASNQNNEISMATNDIPIFVSALLENDDRKINGLPDEERSVLKTTSEIKSNSVVISSAEKKDVKKSAFKSNTLENGERSKKFDKKN